ncbi:MAG: bifunctional diaminohydroxyphosphoribosylaminopyrimidine deaminase/5-amino-6-(5-phosphoribosylamino)uracil reductase RibD [Planctomycetota bacterium]|nr:bifunctional diaminohydroxyphosphoribosylaminopyrimidine deaminase/5-amino-6-(5-phosphoribosylamino)uracil reductase RibD [Planctomycetota bacterium]MDI6787179.1 bifunctional diaminohydroxyphosphoribosylaminopyrimidine deaminase/5-amino-6-(5-phosphoribosylamino)uracil reductase RibD [Planctomycetota bacterium]
MNDEKYLRMTLALARYGEGKVEPNPLVGAVIVKNNRVIGRGYHHYFGGPHAEIVAINKASAGLLSGATLYVTLEPCVHFGKTPPCAPAIVQSCIKRVVIASRDPNPIVQGKGIRFLRQHGVSVTETKHKDILKEALRINRPFFKVHEKGIPYVIAKWAMSLDGRIATSSGDSKWISSKQSRNIAHKLRAKVQGVMVGINTILQDNPFLLAPARPDARSGGDDKGNNPIRIILDSFARLPLNSNIIKTLLLGRVYAFVSSYAPKSKTKQLSQKGARLFLAPYKEGKLDLISVLKILAKNGINKIMIEGGEEVLGSAFDNRVVDEIYCFISPKIIGGCGARSPVGGKGIGEIKNILNLKDVTVKYLKPDVLIRGYLV